MATPSPRLGCFSPASYPLYQNETLPGDVMSIPQLDPGALARQLLDLTRQQVQAATAGDWEQVLDLIDQRAPLSAAVVALDPARLDEVSSNQVRAALTATLELDQQITDLIQTARAQLGRDVTQLRRGSRMLDSYTSAASGAEGRLLDHAS